VNQSNENYNKDLVADILLRNQSAICQSYAKDYGSIFKVTY